MRKFISVILVLFMLIPLSAFPVPLQAPLILSMIGAIETE